MSSSPTLQPSSSQQSTTTKHIPLLIGTNNVLKSQDHTINNPDQLAQDQLCQPVDHKPSYQSRTTLSQQQVNYHSEQLHSLSTPSSPHNAPGPTTALLDSDAPEGSSPRPRTMEFTSKSPIVDDLEPIDPFDNFESFPFANLAIAMLPSPKLHP